MSFLAPVLALLAFAAGQASAPAPAAPRVEEEQACVLIGMRWRGAGDEVRLIESAPVPPSFRRYFDAVGCGRMIDEKDLIDWHLAFGTEASVAAALAFLEVDRQRGLPAPADYPAGLQRAWDRARPDLRGVARLDQTPEGRRQAEAAFQSRPRLVRLVALTRAYENYIFLARHYLRAAEFHGSRALFEKARSFHAPARAAFTLRRGWSLGPALERLGPADWQVGEIHDLDMRMAIMQARLSRDPADIDAAALVVARNYDPLLLAAIQNWEDEPAICSEARQNRDNGETPPGAMRAACEDDDYFVWRVIDFWRNRASVDLLMAADPAHYHRRNGPGDDPNLYFARGPAPAAGLRFDDGWNVARATDAMTWAIRTSPAGTIRENGLTDQLIGLHLLRADAQARAGKFVRRQLGSNDEAPEGETGAMRDLWRALAFAPPTEAPARFRQIATLYLALHREAVAHAGSTVDGPRRFPIEDRNAAYFRLVLDHLDAIMRSETAAR